MEKKKYDLVICDTVEELISVVNIAIDQGYYPKGGMLYVNEMFIQTIYLREEEPLKAG